MPLLDSLAERILPERDIRLFCKTLTSSATGVAGGTNPISSMTLELVSLPGHALLYNSSTSAAISQSSHHRPRGAPSLDAKGVARPPRDKMPHPLALTCVLAVRLFVMSYCFLWRSTFPGIGALCFVSAICL